MKPEELRKVAEVYADVAELRRGWLVRGEKAAAGVMRRVMRRIAQKAFDAGITLPEFLDAIAQYEEENKH